MIPGGAQKEMARTKEETRSGVIFFVSISKLMDSRVGEKKMRQLVTGPLVCNQLSVYAKREAAYSRLGVKVHDVFVRGWAQANGIHFVGALVLDIFFE